MRIALVIHFQKFPDEMSYVENSIEGTSQELHDYQLTEYTGAEVFGQAFTCGNPDNQTIHGMMQLFNDRSLSGDTFHCNLVCILDVPTTFNLMDVVEFLSPYSATIAGIRIIRDRTADTFMVLLKFLDEEKAEEFFVAQHDKPYNMLEESICHLAFVKNLQFANFDVHPETLAAGPLIELPPCAVCLERMDESTTGILTVLCNHTFHCDCMSKCLTCPVCRFDAVPPENTQHICMVCGNSERLWLCLICGYVGCGRYEGGHARGHFERTNHTYCMDIVQRCVWDYIGDNYVHRLIQNKADGKLVAVTDSDGTLDEKFESLTLEYTYLLTKQLESQRQFFEEKLSFVEEDACERVLALEQEVARLKAEKGALLEDAEQQLEVERRKTGKRAEKVHGKLAEMRKELDLERELNRQLQENQAALRSQVSRLEDEMRASQEAYKRESTGLQEQIQDLMFHIQSKSVIENSPLREEIVDGHLHTSTSASSSSHSGESSTPRRRNQKKKK